MFSHTLSIIIPFYNVENVINSTLNSISFSLSIYGQNNITLIFVNNNSDDNSKFIIEEWSKNCTVPVIITDEHMQGVSFARNRGLSLVTTDFVGFIDADDQITPSYFTRIMGCLDFSVDVVVIKIYCENTNLNMRHIYSGDVECNWFDSLGHINGWWNVGFISRKVLFDNSQFIGTCFEDYGLFPIIISKAKLVRIISEPLYQYNVNQGSVIRNTNINKVQQLQFQYNRLIQSLDPKSKILIRIKRDYFESLTLHRAIIGVMPVQNIKELVLLLNFLESHSFLSMLIRLFYRILSVFKRKVSSAKN